MSGLVQFSQATINVLLSVSAAGPGDTVRGCERRLTGHIGSYNHHWSVVEVASDRLNSCEMGLQNTGSST